MLPLVDQLATTWRSISNLCASLTEEQWKLPTGCPGWTVQDQVSHLVDYEATALGRDRPETEVADAEHLRNDLGRANEVGIEARRGRSGAEVLAEFDDVTAARLEQLARLTDDDLTREATLPVGEGTLGDALTMRVMDSWSHEQDIRRAVGRPGHADGPAVATTIGYWLRFMPYAVAKLGGAPDGTTAVFQVGDQPPVAVVVEGGRGRHLDEVPDRPTTSLRFNPETFAALVGGRTDGRPEDVDVTGDIELGRHLATNLGFLP